MFLWLVKETLMAKFMGSCVMLKCEMWINF